MKKLFFKEKEHLFIISLQESFITMVPYFLLTSMLVLSSQLLGYFDFLNHDVISYISRVVKQFTSVVVLVSISYHFSNRYSVNTMMVTLLSIAIFASIIAIKNIYTGDKHILLSGFSIFTIMTPIVVTMVFKRVLRYINLSNYDFRNPHVLKIFKYIYPFVITYILIFSIFYLLFLTHMFFDGKKILFLSLFSNNILLFIRTLLSQVFWFLGMHGPHVVNSIFDTSFLKSFIFPNLTYIDFYRIFALSGGSGMGLSLIIALFMNKNDKNSLKIAKLATPFAIFNINEILIFGLPIIFNRYFLIPFVFVPIINMAIAFAVLSIYPIEFLNVSVAWITPIFLDSYLMSGGDIVLFLLQLFLLFVGAFIYFPFVKKYTKTQSLQSHFETLEDKLNISLPLKSKEDINSYKAQKSIIESNYKIDNIIEMLSKDTLMVYYQPKVDITDYTCNSFEALLRLRLSNGKVVGPFFLEDIEKAGLATIIDVWVCKKVKEDIKIWNDNSFYPNISVNLHPDSLQDSDVIKEISNILKNKNIEFEIIERSLLEGEKSKNNLKFLKNHGFKISIDDFGVGYSSFETISSFDIDTIKLDKSIVDAMSNEKGYIVCKYMIKLCDSLNIQCVVEGVEEKGQLDLLEEINAKYIQGFYFSKAISADRLLNYKPN